MASFKNFQVDRNKRKNNINIFSKNRNFGKNDKLSKSERLLDGVGTWTSFYRSNPQRFVKDYLGINLKLFQQILIYMMMHNNYFMYLASRGQGKTYLTALFCVVRCILFPETKIIVASGVKSQAKEVISKIENEMLKNSPNLAREIEEIRADGVEPKVEFHNGSWIRTVAANDNARSKRSNVLIIDEYRMVDLDIITKVLRKFQTAPRQPKYLNKQQYKHLQERNKELYLSSAWYTHHWSWDRMKTYFSSMMKGNSYFVCGLPYYVSILEGLLMREQVEDEMAEDDFDEIAWYIEMECMFFGESEKAYFKFEDLEENRRIHLPVFPKSQYDFLKDSKFKYEEKKDGEIRLLSCDIAGMAGKENDASVFSLIRLIPNSKGYERQLSYMESVEGGHTVTQAIRIRQLYEDLDCDYIVLDTQSIGLGVFDQLVIPQFDKERSVEYEPFTCINDERMAERCSYEDAPARIYSIKGSAQLNSECAISLKDALKRKKFKLPVSEMEGKDSLKRFKGFDKLPVEQQTDYLTVYVQATLLVNEMINLENKSESGDGLVKLKEPRSKRKDRYSSVSYGNYIANQLERELLAGNKEDISDYMFFMQSGF